MPENPPPLPKESEVQESVNPTKKLDHSLSTKPTSLKFHNFRNIETVNVKQHELSVEQQIYYTEITEACVGSDEVRRRGALNSLSVDPGLHELLPRLSIFITEGVKVNVIQNNLALLIYLMRMVEALLDNSSLYLEKYVGYSNHRKKITYIYQFAAARNNCVKYLKGTINGCYGIMDHV